VASAIAVKTAFAALFAALAVPCYPSTARAQAPTPEARAHARALADEAANSYAAGQYEHAHQLLGSAFAFVPAPTISLLDARALVQLGRWVEAREAYLRTIASQAPKDAGGLFEKAIADARVELGALEPRIPSLKIKLVGAELGPPPRISIDGQFVPLERASQPLLLDPKWHWVRVQMQGKKAADEQVSLSEGEQRTLTLELAKPEAPVPKADPQRTWGFISLGAGGIGVVTGAIAGAVAMHAHSQAEDECPERRCLEGSSGADALERFRTYRDVSTIGYVAGVAGLGLGAVLLVTSSHAKTRIGIAPTWNGVHLVGAL
jgi:hypothetical protein